jgi:hypothetical protein
MNSRCGRQAILPKIASLEFIETDAGVLDRAAQPMPTELGTLDAVDLSSALPWQETTSERPMVADHSRVLAIAAPAYGMRILGMASALTKLTLPAQRSATVAEASTNFRPCSFFLVAADHRPYSWSPKPLR